MTKTKTKKPPIKAPSKARRRRKPQLPTPAPAGGLSEASLEAMSREDKLQLLAALEEKERRRKLSRKNYIPNKGQRPFHLSTAMIRIVASGNGAGKTTAAIQEAMWKCAGYNPLKKVYTKTPTEVVVLLDQARKSDDIWVKEAKKWFVLRPEQIKKKGRPYTSEIQFDNGSRIIFLTQESPEMAFEGLSDYSLVIADEPCPHWQFKALFRGARDKSTSPEFLLIGTPIGSNSAWIRQLWNNWSQGMEPDVECFRTSMSVNAANLPDGFQEKFAARLSEAEQATRIEGLWGNLEGLALSHLWRRDTHIIDGVDLDEGAPHVLAVDCHPSKKNVAVMLAVDKHGLLYVVDEIAVKATAREFAPFLKEMMVGRRMVDITCDSLGNGDGTGGEGFKSFIQVLRECGIKIRSTTYNDKSDEAFIDRMQTTLLIPSEPNHFDQCIPKLRFLSHCKGAINDVENVGWQRDKRNEVNKPKLEISNKDFLACIKYGLACNLHPTKHKSKAYYQHKLPYGLTSRINRAKKQSKLTW